jgi:hypothetical protein
VRARRVVRWRRDEGSSLRRDVGTKRDAGGTRSTVAHAGSRGGRGWLTGPGLRIGLAGRMVNARALYRTAVDHEEEEECRAHTPARRNRRALPQGRNSLPLARNGSSTSPWGSDARPSPVAIAHPRQIRPQAKAMVGRTADCADFARPLWALAPPSTRRPSTRQPLCPRAGASISIMTITRRCFR